jgi:hypothetical protein
LTRGDGGGTVRLCFDARELRVRVVGGLGFGATAVRAAAAAATGSGVAGAERELTVGVNDT